jgi:hypothetical protein
MIDKACRCGKARCPAANKLRAHLWYALKPALTIARAVAWNKANPEKHEAAGKRWAGSNREKVNANARRFHARHPHKKVAHNVKRKAAKLRATPEWLTADDWSVIEDIYRQMRAMNAAAGYRKYGVDHVIPLRGRTVCGLHVPGNLAIKTRSENSRKHNKFLPEHLSVLTPVRPSA